MPWSPMRVARGNVGLPPPCADPTDLRRGGGDAPGDRAGEGRGCIGLHRPPLVRRCAGGGRCGQGARLAGLRRDLPPLPDPDRCAIRRRPTSRRSSAASSRRRSAPSRIAARCGSGLRAGGLDLVATDHVPDRLAVEKRCPAPPFPQISNGAPGIETLLSVIYDEGVAGGRITVERMVDLLATTPARLFGMASEGRDRGRARRRPRPLRPAGAGAPSARRSCTTPATSRRTRAARCTARCDPSSSGERRRP